MSMGRCSRCGRKADLEYGSDGQGYCNSCSFYGLNKQCWRCRMYLPAVELQQYRGQWICPNCINDIKEESLHATRYTYHQQCDRCGREAQRFYTWNGRRLCISCLNDEQNTWGTASGGPTGGAGRVLRPLKEDGSEGLISRIISWILIKLKLKKKKAPEIISIGKEITPFDRAKTMNEDELERVSKKKAEEDKKSSFSLDNGQVEGIRKKTKKKKRNKK